MRIIIINSDKVRPVNSAVNEDQENYPIALKFYKSLWYILFDVPYKFLRDSIIFRRFMLFLVCTFWFVKIKRKIKNSDSDVTFFIC